MSGSRRSSRPGSDERREARVRAAIIELVDTIDTRPIAVETSAPRRACRRSSPRRRAGLLTGLLAAAAVVLAVVLAGLPSAHRGSASGGGGATFPDELPAYRVWRLSQDLSPLSQVAVSYAFNPDHDYGFLDAPHEVLLGADLSTTRHFDSPGGIGTMVSPSGRRLASLAAEQSAVRIDDLGAESQVTTAIPRERPDDTADLLSWSPDSTRVYLRVGPRDPATASERAGTRIWELDASGQLREVPGTWAARAVAAAPDGTRLAVVRSDGRVDVVDRRDGRLLAAPVGPSGLTPLAQLAGTDRAQLPDDAMIDGLLGDDARHAPVDVMWSPSGDTLVALERQSPALVPQLLRGYWQGTIATVVDVGGGATRVVRLTDYGCRPLAMLSEASLLCESSAATEPAQKSWYAANGLTTVDLGSGQVRVVARFPRLDNGVWHTYVAADLARTWRFSMSQPWVDPGPETS